MRHFYAVKMFQKSKLYYFNFFLNVIYFQIIYLSINYFCTLSAAESHGSLLQFHSFTLTDR